MKHPRYTWRWALGLVTVIVAPPLLYAFAALVLGLVPINRDWRPEHADGIAVWLTTNGVHAGIAMPARTSTIDWTGVFPRTDMRDGRGDYVTVGWGDREFFLYTPAWSDLTASTAIHALSGTDGAVMHVEYGPAPVPGRDAAPMLITPDAYSRLVDYVRASVPLQASGGAKVIPGHHYADDDAFYEAHGRYSLFVTCNQWTRNALSAAGVRVPAWSPFDRALFWHLSDTPQAPPRSSTH